MWSWAATDLDVAERREHVEGLVGNRFALVRYMTIDYLREELHPELTDSGVRFIEDAREWERPTWRCDGFNAVDFGVELEMMDGETWSLTWDPPGNHQGIGIRKGPLIGSVVVPDRLTAVWDATLTSLWSPMLRTPIETVELHYTPEIPRKHSATHRGEPGSTQRVTHPPSASLLIGQRRSSVRKSTSSHRRPSPLADKPPLRPGELLMPSSGLVAVSLQRRCGHGAVR